MIRGLLCLRFVRRVKGWADDPLDMCDVGLYSAVSDEGTPMNNQAAEVTIAQIAGRLNVQPGTVHRWRQRNLGFPKATRYVGATPVWDWPAVKAWAIESGRLTQ